MRLSFTKIIVTAVLAVALVLTFAGAALAAFPWTDAGDSYWAGYSTADLEVTADLVHTLADGYDDYTFKPGNPVTRGQFAKMAVNGLEVEPLQPMVPAFRDVLPGSTFYDYIEGAYAVGLVGGWPVEGGLEYRPHVSISRQQTNSILARYLSAIEKASTGGYIHGDGGSTFESLDSWYRGEGSIFKGSFYLTGFLDVGDVAVDHRATTAYLVYHGIVLGSGGRLSPLAGLARSQAAVMVLRVAARAAELSVTPPAPTGLSVVETGGKVVVQTAPAVYVGNDATPQVKGTAMIGRPVAVYDSFGGANIKLTETASNAAGQFYADLTAPLADGTHRFTAVVTSTVGQVSLPSIPIDYVVDTIAPSGTITAPVVAAGQANAALNSSQPQFTVAAEDERSGVDRVAFQYALAAVPTDWMTVSTDAVAPYAADWGALSLPEGQYLFRAVVTDIAGNSQTLDAVPVTIDITPPVAQIAPGSLAPEAGWDGIYYTEDRTPVFGGLCEDSVGSGAAAGAVPGGVVLIEFLYAPIGSDAEEWDDFSLISDDLGTSGFAAYDAVGIPTEGIPEGEYLFAVRATDRAGNQSLLMSGDPVEYVAGVVQQVVIDATPPAVAFIAPIGGELLADETDYSIGWTLTDVSPPETVIIEYSLDDGQTWIEIDAQAGFETSPASYEWTVPDVAGDMSECRVRITAVDKAGVALGKTGEGEGHYTQVISGTFTIYDSPAAPTNVVGEDPDSNEAGVDWRDFGATWTTSPSLGVVKQEVYLLPGDVVALDLEGAEPDVPIATFDNRTTAAWVSTEALSADSSGAVLAEGQYKIWIVVTDGAGRTAVASSQAFAATAP